MGKKDHSKLVGFRSVLSWDKKVPDTQLEKFKKVVEKKFNLHFENNAPLEANFATAMLSDSCLKENMQWLQNFKNFTHGDFENALQYLSPSASFFEYLRAECFEEKSCPN